MVIYMFLKTLLKYLIISLVQGFTEPLPISSSAHMIIISSLLDIKTNDLTLEIFLNFASMLAIFIFVFTKRMNLKSTIKNPILLIKIIIASIPTVICGLLFKAKIEKFSINFIFIGVTLLITCLMLLLSYRLFNKTKENNVSNKNALKLGFGQTLALLPGISRMGSVLTTGILCRIKIRTILDFSFLMYLVVSLGSFILSIPDLLTISINLLPIYLISFIATFIITYFSIKWFYNIINKKTLLVFSFYTLILGIILIIIGY